VGLSDIDRKLLERCLDRQGGAWEDFVDRFLGLVVHVIHHTAQSRSFRPTPADVDELAGEVFLTIVRDDFATLRQFRGESSLATYLTVVSRRVVVRELLKRHALTSLESLGQHNEQADQSASVEERIGNRDEIERLLEELDAAEAEVVRLYHLEGKSYREISARTGVPENSIGPTLSRARQKMRSASTGRASGTSSTGRASGTSSVE
jgi:RNA polymerase sigma-70 factor (ECF subfamily)